ncbi:putative uncharacterized protein [Waddlia chondrophila 2032/99]|uniref:Methyltransferase n=2 Tax=Waddlia chondrophila TaxID=71667 RepID=D6YSQ1_WADCW|nr:class I SAM-dependent methyltransferase [Waddlia chondrophila]ADI39096.1 conserved hypothetical protein [Waddlia chondrophila WSU 86-1044]CCB92207.1 putative uncharacterized protein [Waddlia chondrophila 2032/99]
MIFLFLLIFILSLVVVWTMKNGISPMPSSSKATNAIVFLLPEIEGTVYELGSGWGHLLFPLCERYPNNPVIGIESSPIPYLFSKILSLFLKKPNLILLRKNFFNHSLADASLIVCYLYPGAMEKLRDKFQKELHPGTTVISNTFAIPGWIPMKTYVLDDLYRTKIYLYRT